MAMDSTNLFPRKNEQKQADLRKFLIQFESQNRCHPGKNNPVDIETKGLSPTKLEVYEIWWKRDHHGWKRRKTTGHNRNIISMETLKMKKKVKSLS
ncbi:hypothetical protein WUBG_13433 [Wuchereria bancrofti]|uniref:Uncharacterized protein n=1 Tax=Wuchereria bancrofti TaxID=6293 RepID=J9EJY0_WUCBA|nr:hypothetical protein WUBG_13433 [Wuchereria bancrofti]